MNDAVAFQQYQVAALKARSRVLASDQEGGSMDRLVNDYARQVGDYQTIQDINEGLRTRQYTREQAGAGGAVPEPIQLARASTSRSPTWSRLPPFACRCRHCLSPGPTMTGSGPSGAAAGPEHRHQHPGRRLRVNMSAGFSTFAQLKSVASK
jgi:hypothetical protein